MKRITAFGLMLFMLFSMVAHAEDVKEPVPARYTPVLETFGAANGEELYVNMLPYMNEIQPDSNFTVKRYPLKIRFGGTTEELIADQKNWGLAVVSSKEVDLQVLADEKLLRSWTLSPNIEPALHQRLLPENLQNLMPDDITKGYDVYFFDYDTQTDDATLLIGSQKNEAEFLVPKSIMNKRTADQVRAMEGICRVAYWTEEELLASPDDWDTATLQIQMPDGLKRLDDAGLLLDLSQNTFLASRTTREDTVPGYLEIINGIYSADGRMIGIPSEPFQYARDEVEVLS